MTGRSRCPQCQQLSPAGARNCMHCGAPLPADDSAPAPPHSSESPVSGPRAGLGIFLATTLGTLALSAVLIFVLHLPVFLLVGVLPLVWFGAARRR